MMVLKYLLSVIYSFIVQCRNYLYDKGILSHWTPPVKTICVGNLTVGGTGKTPHALFLMNLLQKEAKVAFLSRGYKRKTRGFVDVNLQSTSQEVGDEPLLVKKHFENVPVAVCEKRKEGIEKLLKAYPDVECIVLDDAMQHRAISPGRTLLLTTCDRLYVHDKFLPYGRLRDAVREAKRADWIMVTKCPNDLQESEQLSIESALKPLRHQRVFFTTIRYGQPQQIWGDLKLEWSAITSVCLVAGIANPQPLEDYLKDKKIEFKSIHYADHHAFTKQDVQYIVRTLAAMKQDTLVLTTEKDAMRMLTLSDAFHAISKRVYYVPMEVEMINKSEEFTKIIKDYVREN